MTAVGAPPAIVTPDRVVDRQALDRLAEEVRSGVARTMRPGTPVGLWVDDDIAFAVCALGTMAAGAEGFIIPPAGSAEKALELCDLEGGTSILCDSAHAGQLVGGDRRQCGDDLVIVDFRRAPVMGDNVGGSLHFYTSGTDGRPKGVIRTRESLALEEMTVGPHLGMTQRTRVLCALPVTHGYGYTAGVFAPIRYGGTSILARPKLAASLARLLTEHEPEIVVAVPAQYAAWSALRRGYSGPLPRIWLCGGAPLPTAVRARFESAWGSVISEQYGMTECGAVTVDLEGTGTLGRPYPGVEVFIDGATHPGDVGEVVACAPYGPQGYVGDPAGNRFTPQGFRSGDSGWLDDEGRLHLVGRRAHQLNVRGRQVDPAEIERALWAVDGVDDVAVVGVDRAEGDQWVAAFVVCGGEVGDGVLNGATDKLEPYKRPQRVIRLPVLPKNSTGKTDFEALRAMTRTAGAPQ